MPLVSTPPADRRTRYICATNETHPEDFVRNGSPGGDAYGRNERAGEQSHFVALCAPLEVEHAVQKKRRVFALFPPFNKLAQQAQPMTLGFEGAMKIE